MLKGLVTPIGADFLGDPRMLLKIVEFETAYDTGITSKPFYNGKPLSCTHLLWDSEFGPDSDAEVVLLDEASLRFTLTFSISQDKKDEIESALQGLKEGGAIIDWHFVQVN